MFQLMQRLKDRGVPRQNILYLNFFDDRLHFLRHGGLGMILDAYFSLYPEKKDTEKIYCFFDEIQGVPGWEPFVDRLLRTEKMRSHDHGVLGADAVQGNRHADARPGALVGDVSFFHFGNILISRGSRAPGRCRPKSGCSCRRAFEQYWETGGFPEVAGQERHLRIKTHQEYFNALLFRDLIERHDVSHPKAVTDLAHWLVDHTASLYSINSLTGYLKSLGHKAPKSVVGDYLEWFEDAYFLFTVRIFDASLARANTNPKKIYCIDHALVTSVASGILVNSGHQLENLVFTALRRVYPEIFYYKTCAGREVDFVAQRRDRSRILVQVCETLADPQTRKRELAALGEAMSELKMTRGTIVTRNEEETTQADGRTVDVVPAWRFLLGLPESGEESK